jgi:UDP-N-acetylglucosamine 1-carboxyvinyltransferase
MEEYLQIVGQKPLIGSIKAAGAKNAITKILVASLISNRIARIYNVPNITEVSITKDLCESIGMVVEWDKKNAFMQVQTKEIKTTRIPQNFSGANRIPILMLGALLARTNESVIVPTIGGCKIGARPINFHIQALEKLGASIEYRQSKEGSFYVACAPNGLTGAHIVLPYPSVGATENAILASCSAKGLSVIKNAAIEPEIIDLILFLQKMGVPIYVDVNRTIHIQGTKTFFDVEHHTIADRIEVASFAMAAIATRGRVFIEGARQHDLITFLNKLRELGGNFTVKKGGIEFFYDRPLMGGIQVETDVHPAFLTDWAQPFTVLLSQAKGTSVMHETVYENRFGFANELKTMGADIELFYQCLGNKPCRFVNQNHYHSAIIKGVCPLEGKTIAIPDLRAGFAYVMAALVAKGQSTITNLHYLQRGYEDLAFKLQSLGANCQQKQIELLKI